MNSLSYKQEVADIMQRLYQRGLTTCSGGNVSLRAENGHVFITPSQIDKGNIRPEEVAEMDAEGKLLTPELKPSMETGMHLEIYRKRKDVQAIVHAHPPKATAWACSSEPLKNNLCGEARYFLGEIARAPYRLMGTEGLAEAVVKGLGDSKAVLLDNHGALTVGDSLFKAYDRMEVLESLAELQINLRIIGRPVHLSENQQEKLDNY
jgi:L-fuculose-phosphate aldolase